LPEVFVEALTSKAVLLSVQGRPAEARLLLEAAVARAYEEQLFASALRAENNLGFVLELSDRYAEVLEIGERAVALARRRGDRRWEANLRTGSLIILFLLGQWDDAVSMAAEERPLISDQGAQAQLLYEGLILCERGILEPASSMLAGVGHLRETDSPQARGTYGVVEARLLRAQGETMPALVAAERAIGTLGEMSISSTEIKLGLVEAVEAALILSDFDKAEELLSIPQSLEPGELTPFLQAHSARLRARLDAARDDHQQVEKNFRTAMGLFLEFGVAFHLAVTQLEFSDWLLGRGRAEEAAPLLAEARAAFVRLKATPWIDRVDQATPAREPEIAVG
jgi:tetratricopeptide (TPR) repeat protein